MDLSICQAGTGFSLDELVEKLADVFERKAFSELLKMILQLVQRRLVLLHHRRVPESHGRGQRLQGDQHLQTRQDRAGSDQVRKEQRSLFQRDRLFRRMHREKPRAGAVSPEQYA